MLRSNKRHVDCLRYVELESEPINLLLLIYLLKHAGEHPNVFRLAEGQHVPQREARPQQRQDRTTCRYVGFLICSVIQRMTCISTRASYSR